VVAGQAGSSNYELFDTIVLAKARRDAQRG